MELDYLKMIDASEGGEGRERLKLVPEGGGGDVVLQGQVAGFTLYPLYFPCETRLSIHS